MAQRTDQTWERLNAELEALRERVAELEAAADEREALIETSDWRGRFRVQGGSDGPQYTRGRSVHRGKRGLLGDTRVPQGGGDREDLEELGILEPGERDALRAAVAEKGFVRNVPVTVRTKGGKLRHGLFSADIVRRSDQVCWFIVVTDTTAQKQAEEALLENEANWRSILENAPGIIAATDPDGTVTFVNRTLSGISPERVVGTSVFDHVPPQFRARCRTLSSGPWRLARR